MRRTRAKDPQLHVSLASASPNCWLGVHRRWPSSETARFGVFDGESFECELFVVVFGALDMMIPVWSLGLATNGLLALGSFWLARYVFRQTSTISVCLSTAFLFLGSDDRWP